MTMTLSALHVFPVKSCAPLPVEATYVELRGLRHDRRWMVVDAEGRFISAREESRMTLLRAVPGGDFLTLEAPGMHALRVALPVTGTQRRTVSVWGDSVDAACAGQEADAWLTTFLGRPAQLVAMDARAQRAVDPDYGAPGDVVSFADGYPMLLISQAAMDQLNEKLATPLPILRFRPNFVVAGSAPHAEDAWKRIRIGDVEFDLVKHCVRCVLTTVDFERGERSPDGEPLRTLITYRRGPKGVTFGQNLIPRGTGRVAVGDRVEVLA